MSAAPSRIGLALAGGGPLGAIYEIGALCALQDALPALDLTRLDGYVGVSAGGFIAAALANGITPRELCAAVIENRGEHGGVFRPSVLLQPAWGELGRRTAALPVLGAQATLAYAFGRRRSLLSAVERLGRALPTGLFSNAPLEAQLRRVFEAPGRTNDFRRLARKLVVVATDLDSGAAATFGQPGWDTVPISRAVQASAALPGLFPPVRIGGRHYVDGALKKTLHARVLLDEGMDLLLCLNPLVPFQATPRARRGAAGLQIPQLVAGGLPLVLSQTLRSLIHSRLALGMAGYAETHPHADILLFEPDRHDPELFLANLFSTAQRRVLAEHAYQQTRAMLRMRRATLGPQLARHGVVLDDAMLDDPQRHLLEKRRRGRRLGRALHRLDEVLDSLETALAERRPAV
jgi:predicted acylesterase/phospholipase RssA